MSDFAHALIVWQKQYGRHALPWQQTRDAYRIWLSEIMLQQTQVQSVIAYYQRFVARFPTIGHLAEASLDEVMALWAGLGYYSRARNLHHCAQQVVARFAGDFPADLVQLQSLPGIGRSTAAAIAAFAYGVHAPILDGNVKRVLSRVFGVDGYPGLKTVETQLWQLAHSLLPVTDIEAYTQGLMDFGATVCKRSKPLCLTQYPCPFLDRCVAYRDQRTAALPEPKPKKAVPLRHAFVYIVRHQQRVLLLRRPPSGIWGGLWTFPQMDALAAMPWPSEVQATCVNYVMRFGEIKEYQALPEVYHAFTHFRLRLLPVLFELSTVFSQPNLASTDQAQWFTQAQLLSTGLPAPIKRLLTAIMAS
ncbi:MAG: A/G-specific adenine glycosylase [Ottowia sp.]|nr:A/G-specific adenine glycosylase [Ottowia sp.]